MSGVIGAALYAIDSWLWLVIVVLYALFSLGGAISTAIRRGRAQQPQAAPAEEKAAPRPAISPVRAASIRRVAVRSPSTAQPAVATIPTRAVVVPQRAIVPEPPRPATSRGSVEALVREIRAGRQLAAALVAGVIMGPPAAYRPGGHEAP